MWASLYLRNIALKFVLQGLSSLSRNKVCKTDLVFQVACFGDLLLNKKQKKPCVWLKDKVTITQWFLTSASLAQVDKHRTKLIRICFVVTFEGLIWGRWNLFFFVLFFFFFQKPSLCLCNWIAVFTGRDLGYVFQLPLWRTLLARKAITRSQSWLTC